MKLKRLLVAAALLCSIQPASANDFALYPNYNTFKIKAMQKYGLSSEQIDFAMQDAQYLPRIIELMNKPGESKPWYQYKKNFFNPSTVQRGVRFRQQYANPLTRAEQLYGVPQSVILGILGVETGFGANKGSINTRDALATLAFNYPRRSEYFSDELAALIAWTYQDGRNINGVKGSYAGALGYPQFMPSNINAYGVDFDGDGHINLLDSPIDAIGSIANYLAKHGWERNRPIAYRGYFKGNNPETVVAKPFQLHNYKTFAEMQQLGLQPMDTGIKINDLDLVNGIMLEETYGNSYYLIYPNFNVITSYNNSRMYAAAVWQLGEEIVNQ